MSRITLQQLRKNTPLKDYYKEGQLFEEYIKKLFSEDRFKLTRWRRSFKVPIDTFIGDLSGPDLELIFQQGKKKPFAIECKYRFRFYNRMIGWASEDQIKKYVEFQKRKGMTVLIAIGIGGSPSNPKKLFITPLDHIRKYTHLYESHLISFEKEVRCRTVNAEQSELFNAVDHILQKHQIGNQTQ